MMTSSKRLPLSAAQNIIGYYEILYSGTPAYHQTILFDVEGIQVDLLRTAIASLEKRHENLQYSLTQIDGQIYLSKPTTTSSHSEWPLLVFNYRDVPRPPLSEISATLKTKSQEDFLTAPFVQERDVLWRCALLEFQEKRYQFVMVIHHLIVDGTSKNILMRDLSEFYNALLEGRPPVLPALPDLSTLKSPVFDEKKLEHSKKILSDLDPLNLHTDFPPSSELKSQGKRFYFSMEQKLAKKLSILGQTQKPQPVSFYRVVLTSFFALLYRYTNHRDICIGIASANRRGYSHDVDNVVSDFVNSLPIRYSVVSQQSFVESLNQLSRIIVDTLKNQIPFEILATKAMGQTEKRRISTASPFDIFFNLNEKRTAFTPKDGHASYPQEISFGYTLFRYMGLGLDAQPDGSYLCYFEYNTALFKESTIKRMSQHLINIWSAVAASPDIRIGDISLFTPEESKILSASNQTPKKMPFSGNSVVDIFRHQAKTQGQQRAVVFHRSTTQSEAMTYKELDQKSDILASLLRALNIGPDICVGVSLSRSISLLTALWSIFKAHGVFVPLETESSELLNHKIKDSQSKVILVDNTTKDLETFKSLDKRLKIEIINIDDWPNICRLAASLGIQAHRDHLKAQHLAYITYTSGTTGKPAGVMSTHGGLSNAAFAIRDRKLKPGSKVLCTAKPDFDCFLFEVLEALMTGGELHLIFEEGRLSPTVLHEIISRHELNAITLLPVISNQIDFAALPSLNDIIVMGAVSHPETIKKLCALAQARSTTSNPLTPRFEYGVQEFAIFSTENPFIPGQPMPTPTSIGRPIRGTKLFVIDPETQFECPLGVEGELYISGKGRARGYVGNPQATRARFFSLLYDPKQHRFFQPPEEKKQESLLITKKKRSFEETGTKKASKKSSPASRVAPPGAYFLDLYQTRDRARRLSDGSLEFSGRITGDRQVKIHGVRVALDHLETILQLHPNIKEAVVAFDPHQEMLKCFAIPKDPRVSLSLSELQQFLQGFPLPPVVALTAVYTVDHIPVTNNGKRDLAALEKMATPLSDSKDECFGSPLSSEPPSTLETQLKGYWQEVLGIKLDSYTQSFHQLGGNSINLFQLEGLINQNLALTRKISPPKDLHPGMTIKSLAALLTTLLKNTHSPLFGSPDSNPLSFFETSSSSFETVATEESTTPQQTTTTFTWSTYPS